MRGLKGARSRPQGLCKLKSYKHKKNNCVELVLLQSDGGGALRLCMVSEGSMQMAMPDDLFNDDEKNNVSTLT